MKDTYQYHDTSWITC